MSTRTQFSTSYIDKSDTIVDEYFKPFRYLDLPKIGPALSSDKDTSESSNACYRLSKPLIVKNKPNAQDRKSRIIYPSEQGFHQRSRSPTYQRLRCASEILKEYLRVHENDATYRVNERLEKTRNFKCCCENLVLPEVVLGEKTAPKIKPKRSAHHVKIPHVYFSNPSLRVVKIEDPTTIRRKVWQPAHAPRYANVEDDRAISAVRNANSRPLYSLRKDSPERYGINGFTKSFIRHSCRDRSFAWRLDADGQSILSKRTSPDMSPPEIQEEHHKRETDVPKRRLIVVHIPQVSIDKDC